MSSPQEQFAAMITGLEAAGLSRTDIARQADVSKATITRLGNGDAIRPGYDTIAKLKNLQDSVRVLHTKQILG